MLLIAIPGFTTNTTARQGSIQKNQKFFQRRALGGSGTKSPHPGVCPLLPAGGAGGARSPTESEEIPTIAQFSAEPETERWWGSLSWWRWRELNPRPKALRRDFLRAQTIIAEVLLLLFPSLTADRHAVRSGELHDVWHGQSLPYAHLPLNDALPGSRSFRVGRLPLIRQQQQQCCCYLIYNLPVLWRSGAAARLSRLHTPVETLTPPHRRKVRSAPSLPSAFGCRRGLRSLPCPSSRTKICGSLRVSGGRGSRRIAPLAVLHRRSALGLRRSRPYGGRSFRSFCRALAGGL